MEGSNDKLWEYTLATKMKTKQEPWGDRERSQRRSQLGGQRHAGRTEACWEDRGVHSHHGLSLSEDWLREVSLSHEDPRGASGELLSLLGSLL